jgi:drug/metabolite transporter (DMT)-like permease
LTGRRPLGHWLLLACLVAMWGSSFLFTKIALSSFSPTSLVGARIALATLLLAAMMLTTGRRLPRDRRNWLFFLLLALTGNVVPFLLISWGQQSIDSGLAGILMAVMPLTTVVLAHFFAGERLNARRGAGFLLGFLGIVVLTGPAALLEFRGQGTPLLAELAVLAGAICYAVNTIITRRRPPGDSLVATGGVMLVASSIVLPLSLGTRLPEAAEITLAAWGAVAFLGFVSTALATVVYFKLIAVDGPGFMSLTNYLIPLCAVAIGFVVLDEVPDGSALLALALILSGIGLSEQRRRGGNGDTPQGGMSPSR